MGREIDKQLGRRAGGQTDRAIELSIYDQKCELFTLNVVDTKTCEFQVTNYGTTVLGTPVGSHSYFQV